VQHVISHDIAISITNMWKKIMPTTLPALTPMSTLKSTMGM
jgi:hypothetical protein